MFLKLN